MHMFKYLQVDMTGGILTDDMENVIILPSKEQISLWPANDLKKTRKLHQIQILSQIPGHFLDLKHNMEGPTRLR